MVVCEQKPNWQRTGEERGKRKLQECLELLARTLIDPDAWPVAIMLRAAHASSSGAPLGGSPLDSVPAAEMLLPSAAVVGAGAGLEVLAAGVDLALTKVDDEARFRCREPMHVS